MAINIQSDDDQCAPQGFCVGNDMSISSPGHFTPDAGAGHSLGGAMANLAAYDLAQEIKAQGLMAHLACYTFGAPRTGNHAFARDYREAVPDTWGLINDQVSRTSSCSSRTYSLVSLFERITTGDSRASGAASTARQRKSFLTSRCQVHPAVKLTESI